MANLVWGAQRRILDDNGSPVSGGKIYVYEAGTTTPATTYSDNGLSSANAHPVVADSSGRTGPIYIGSANYKVRTTDESDVVIQEDDHVYSAQPRISVLRPQEFGTIDGTDDATVINAALAAAASKNYHLAFPPVAYTIKSQITIPDEVEIHGLGNRRGATRGNYKGPALVYHSDLATTPMVRAKSTPRIQDIGFKGAAKGTGTALHVQRDTVDGVNYEDTDAYIIGCHFSEWDTCVEHYNRGLHLDDTDFELATVGTNLNWDDANYVDGSSEFDELPVGWRAVYCNDIRGHACTTLFANTGTDADQISDVVLRDINMDLGDVLWAGGARNFSALNCNVKNANTNTGIIRITTASNIINISGGTLFGQSSDKADGQPNYIIRFDGNVAVLNLGGGLVLAECDGSPIYVDGTISGGVISGLAAHNVGGGASTGVIQATGAVTGLSVGPMYALPNASTPIIKGAAAWSRCAIQGITFPSGFDLYSGMTAGVNNNFQAIDLSLEDDSVIDIIPPNVGGFLKFITNPDGTNPIPAFSAEAWYDTGVSPGHQENTGFSGLGGSIDFSTAALAGTTGNNNNVTISAQAGKLQIENRAGSTISGRLSFQ